MDAGESLLQAAKRELQEEFCFELPEGMTVALEPFSVSQTRPVKNTSYLMHSFLGLAHADSNTWLSSLNIDELNQKLADRRATHQALLENGTFWDLPDEEKHNVSPECRRLEWLDLSTAVKYAFQSMNQGLHAVNDFQKEQFKNHRIARRDPMYITMAQLLQLEDFHSVESLLSFTQSVALDQERERAQWLEDGMSPDQVDTVFSQRLKDRQAQNKL